MEKDLLQDLLTTKDKRTPLQKQLENPKVHISEEQYYMEQLRKVLEDLTRFDNEDEQEIVVERIEELEEEMEYLQNTLRELTSRIIRYVQYGY